MKVTVDGVDVEVENNPTILEVLDRVGASVPTLCFDERQAPFGACRVCLVGVDGAPGPVAACTTPCREGLVIDTQDAVAARVRKAIVELVVSELPSPPESGTELARVCSELGITEVRWPGGTHAVRHETDHPYLAFRHELCISCGRCVRACDEIQGTFALTAVGRGFEANVAAGIDEGFAGSDCVSCGACADTCPTGAILEIPLLGGSE